MNDRDYIRQRIRQAREDLGLRQQDVAGAIGTSITNVSDVERGRFGVNADRLAQIARVLQRPVTWFYPPDLALARDDLSQQIQNIAYDLQQLEAAVERLEWPARALARRRVERLKETTLASIRAEYQDLQETLTERIESRPHGT